MHLSGKKFGTSKHVVLVVLMLVYVLNLVDRLIISILATPIKAEFQLSDTQLGLLGGFAFAIFYAGFGIPIAWLSDRRSRVSIISTAIAVWSGFTALCGAAQSFLHLFLARMGVGVGEAGGIAPSYSLISDYFPRHQRARALAIFSFGSPIGAALGILFGGWIATQLDWRAAFAIVGLAGLPVALLVYYCIDEPVRGGLDRTDDSAVEATPRFKDGVAQLARNRSFWLISLGGAFSNIPIYGLLFWLPSFFQRSYGLSLEQVSWFYGSIILIGGISGMWMGGWLGDRLGGKRPEAYVLIPALSFLVSGPAYAFALFAPNMTIAWFLFVLPQTLAFFFTGPMLTAIQHIVAPNMRATASACFLFIANLIGTGLGTVAIGMLSDLMQAKAGEEALRYSILYTLGFYVLAALMFALASRRLASDWHGSAKVDQV